MNLHFALDLTSLKLYNGRRSFYASIHIGSIFWFVSRWDSVRVTPKPGHWFEWRGPEMTWYVGRVRG